MRPWGVDVHGEVHRWAYLASSGSKSRGLRTTANKARPGAVIGGFSFPETCPCPLAALEPPFRGLIFVTSAEPSERLRLAERGTRARGAALRRELEWGRRSEKANFSPSGFF